MSTPKLPEHVTPEMIASELETIARHIRNEQTPDLAKPIDEVDVLHLRQIVNWLEKRWKEKQAR